ncbi:hypothetical protein TASI_0471 [Taylorella asinigenitalis MCE3]|uniref:Uncharacterized protein n=1 Tax=Taylorella asinigenitalis (strain MCE3) TaxID=1008459 RepID=G4QCW6_TAYAM|nr:hypothetical protein TASI_0471 [Taylorella asinigenitalis MCE3]
MTWSLSPILDVLPISWAASNSGVIETFSNTTHCAYGLFTLTSLLSSSVTIFLSPNIYIGAAI